MRVYLGTDTKSNKLLNYIYVSSVKEQMGHSDVKTTLAIYTHLDSQHKKKNVSKLNEYLSESIG